MGQLRMDKNLGEKYVAMATMIKCVSKVLKFKVHVYSTTIISCKYWFLLCSWNYWKIFPIISTTEQKPKNVIFCDISSKQGNILVRVKNGQYKDTGNNGYKTVNIGHNATQKTKKISNTDPTKKPGSWVPIRHLPSGKSLVGITGNTKSM